MLLFIRKPMRFNRNKRQIIGKFDIADFPTFNLKDVSVKIDSGAYTSTIHCSQVQETKEGLAVVFLSEEEEGYTGETKLFKHFHSKKVRSSSGELQERYSIKGEIILFGHVYKTEFTLSKRDMMRYPVLLGRKLLSHNFIIDTSLSNLSQQNKNQKDS